MRVKKTKQELRNLAEMYTSTDIQNREVARQIAKTLIKKEKRLFISMVIDCLNKSNTLISNSSSDIISRLVFGNKNWIIQFNYYTFFSTLLASENPKSRMTLIIEFETNLIEFRKWTNRDNVVVRTFKEFLTLEIIDDIWK